MTTTLTLSPMHASSSAHSNATNNGIQLATLPIRFTLPLPVQSRTTRTATSVFRTRFKVRGAIKVVVGVLVGCLGLIATWWALDIAMWTAVKEWRDDCREQKSLEGLSSARCETILSQELSPPPTWRSFLSRKIGDPFATPYAKMEFKDEKRDLTFGPGLAERDEIGVEVYQQEIRRRALSWKMPWGSSSNANNRILPRKTLASRSPRRIYLAGLIDAGVADECMIVYGASDDRPPHCLGGSYVSTERIKQQGDTAIMYAGTESCSSLAGPRISWNETHIFLSRTRPLTEEEDLYSNLAHWQMAEWLSLTFDLGLEYDPFTESFRSAGSIKTEIFGSKEIFGFTAITTITNSNNNPLVDEAGSVWERGGWRQPTDRSRCIVAGGVGFWEGLTRWETSVWAFLEHTNTWLAVLMGFFYFDWVTDGRGRREREMKRKRDRRRDREKKDSGEMEKAKARTSHRDRDGGSKVKGKVKENGREKKRARDKDK